MTKFWPSSLEISDYSVASLVWFWGGIVLGLGLGFLRRGRPWRAVLSASVISLLGCAVAAHVASVVTLICDPRRGLGRIPLPGPLGTILGFFALALAFLGPLVAAFLAAHALSASPGIAVRYRIAAVLICIYVIYISPWAVDVLLD